MPSTGWPSITERATARWLGRVGYLEAAALQHALVEARKQDEVPDTFLFLEHPPLITLGRASHEEHVLAPHAVLQGRGIEVWETTRGGDVTYHGPGQLVGYGIVDLKRHGRDVARYLRRLEAAIIALCARHGLEGSRREGMTGVWLGDAKVCAMGVRVDHWVTSHGFALNVGPDLSDFDLIVPCGIKSHGVTSLARATGEAPQLEDVAREAFETLADEFGWRAEWDPRALDGPGEIPGRVLGGVRRIV
jgi:lipoyl(octanoyl) transferase